MDRPLSTLVQLRLSGWKFCRSCSDVRIEPDAPAWKKQCELCYKAGKPLIACEGCGEEIDKERRMMARRKGSEPRWCWSCSRAGPMVCKTCGVSHPSSWNCSPASV